MVSPENPQFIPDETGETLGTLRFREFPVGQVYETDEDLFKSREVITTTEPNYDLLEVVFLRDLKHSKQRPDIRDLPIEFKAQDARREFLETRALDAIRAAGLDPVPIPPRYSEKKVEQGPTDEEKYQDNLPGHEDPFKRFFPRKRR